MMKKENAAIVLNELNMRKVAIQSFRNCLIENASMKLLKISFKLKRIFLRVIGVKWSSFSVDLLLIKTAGTKASNVQETATQMDTSLQPASADSNQVGSYKITQNQGAISKPTDQ